MTDFSGLYAPLVTPFTDDGSMVSEVRMARQIRYLNERGISGYVVCSDTGEFTSISFSERKLVLEYTLREAAGRPVLVNVSTLNTSASLDLAQHGARHGARAAVLMPPYYGKYTNDEVHRFIEIIAQYANLPIIVVDPLQRLDENLNSRINSIPNINLAEQLPVPNPFPTHADAFRLGSMVVSPVALLKQHGDASGLTDLFAEFGGRRIGKAGLEILGVEVGSTRGPASAPPAEAQQMLRELLAEQS